MKITIYKFFKGSIYDWVFWHRIHHKFYGTQRDPYNHKKGFFYSHVISNLLSAPSDLKTYARDIDMRDVDEDGFVWTQKKYVLKLLYIVQTYYKTINFFIHFFLYM